MSPPVQELPTAYKFVRLYCLPLRGTAGGRLRAPPAAEEASKKEWRNQGDWQAGFARADRAADSTEHVPALQGLFRLLGCVLAYGTETDSLTKHTLLSVKAGCVCRSAYLLKRCLRLLKYTTLTTIITIETTILVTVGTISAAVRESPTPEMTSAPPSR